MKLELWNKHNNHNNISSRTILQGQSSIISIIFSITFNDKNNFIKTYTLGCKLLYTFKDSMQRECQVMVRWFHVHNCISFRLNSSSFWGERSSTKKSDNQHHHLVTVEDCFWLLWNIKFLKKFYCVCQLTFFSNNILGHHFKTSEHNSHNETLILKNTDRRTLQFFFLQLKLFYIHYFKIEVLYFLSAKERSELFL